MEYRTAKRLALLWLKIKVVFLLLLGTACGTVGLYAITEWPVWICAISALVLCGLAFWLDEHPGSEVDRSVLKFPFSGLTGSRYPKKRQ